MSRSLLAVAMGFSLFGASLFAQSPKPRKWKDASGKFEIDATFVSEANGVVTLKQTNGEEVEIELKQLSPADEAYVKVETAKNKTPFKAKGSTSPFQAKTGGSTPAGTTDPGSSAPAATPSTTPPPAVAINWLNAPLLSAPGEPEWSKISMTPAPAKKLRSAQLPGKREIHERFGSVASGDGFAIVSYTLPDVFRKGITETTRLVRVNLESGKVEGTIITDGLFTVMDVSPTGDQILMRKEAVALGGQATDIELWRPAGKFVERVKSFTPFSGDMQGRQSVDHALLGADGKIVVASNMGRIGIFDSNSGEAIGSMPDGHSAALSPDRKYAVIVGEKVLLIDLTNGDALASFATEKLHHASAAFSPDGQLLAVASGDHLMAWSLKDGKAYRDETIGGLNAGWNSEVIFTSPTHLFAGTTLIDIENHLPVWTYNGITKAMPAGGSTVMLVDRGFQSMLVVSPLPHQAAQLAVKQALGTPGLFAVTPGSTMTVDVSALTDPAQQEKARAGLEARIAAAGMKLTPNSPIVLKASMSTSTEQQEFRTFGLRSEATPVNTTKHTATVEMLVNGKQAWQTSAVSGTGFMISTTKGESLQDAANRQSKADYSLFSTVSIPQYVLQPGMSTLGQSTVSGPNF